MRRSTNWSACRSVVRWSTMAARDVATAQRRQRRSGEAALPQVHDDRLLEIVARSLHPEADDVEGRREPPPRRSAAPRKRRSSTMPMWLRPPQLALRPAAAEPSLGGVEHVQQHATPAAARAGREPCRRGPHFVVMGRTAHNVSCTLGGLELTRRLRGLPRGPSEGSGLCGLGGKEIAMPANAVRPFEHAFHRLMPG